MKINKCQPKAAGEGVGAESFTADWNDLMKEKARFEDIFWENTQEDIRTENIVSTFQYEWQNKKNQY